MSTTADPARWRRLAALFDRAVELDPARRSAFIDGECAGDDELRAQLLAMLAADARPGALDASASEWLGPDTDMPDPAIGQSLGSYRIDGVLGRGGMGVVYRAHRADGAFEQQVAIKRLRERWTDRAQVERFLRERNLLAALTHPNIAHLLDGGLDEHGQPWFAMDLVEGEPLTDWCDRQRLDLRARIDLFREVCAAVQHAHAHFVVHRDLKPGNILVDAEGHPHVLDFGVAKLLAADSAAAETVAAFTPEYAAPEQVAGGAITAATDVYALGVVLYQLLCGRLPYAVSSRNLQAAATAITQTTAPRLEDAITTGDRAQVEQRLRERSTDLPTFRRMVHGDLGRIVQTALAKEPARRYASVDAFSRDLLRYLQGRTVSVSGDTWGYRARSFVRRNRWGVAMAALAGVALLTGIAGVLWQAQQAREQAARATREAHRAEVEAQRAQREVRRVNAINAFLGDVLSSGASAGSTRDMSLRDALAVAVRNAEHRVAQEPDLAIQALIAASASYSTLGDDHHALELTLRAQQIQESRLPHALEERAMVLAQRAYLRTNAEPEAALRWAREALALRRRNPDVTPFQLRDALHALLVAQYGNGDYAGALDTQAAVIAQVRRERLPYTDPEWVVAFSDRALLLGLLGRWREAIPFHRAAISMRMRDHGAGSGAVASERLFYAVTLNRNAQWAEALAQLDVALPVLRRELDAGSDAIPRAQGERGIALVGLGRSAEAVVPLAAAHAYGRDHEFAARQGRYGHYHARALALQQRCDEARGIVTELTQRRIDATLDGRTPIAGTRCEAAP